MKYSDIVKLHEAGLISAYQKEKIIERFDLKEEGGKFLMILSFAGAALVLAGIILLIAANWDEIPRGLKIVGGLLLMLGAHAGGYYLREVEGLYRKSGEALHLIGSGLFLGNIALLGQIYHLSARVPNAFFLWWLGIAVLPWLLRSKAQHLLSLVAFAIWFGLELNEEGSWLRFSEGRHQILLYALLGLIYLGFAYRLRRTTDWCDFADVTEKLGLALFQLFIYPLTWEFFYDRPDHFSAQAGWIFSGLSLLALALIASGLRGEKRLTPQWRWTWGLALAGGIALMAGALLVNGLLGDGAQARQIGPGYNWIAAILLFVWCLLQVQVGLQMRAPNLVNGGVLFMALIIIATYLVLIGSMARTGVVFLVSGVFLIVFGIYLEKKRRALMQRIKAQPPEGTIL